MVIEKYAAMKLATVALIILTSVLAVAQTSPPPCPPGKTCTVSEEQAKQASPQAQAKPVEAPPAPTPLTAEQKLAVTRAELELAKTVIDVQQARAALDTANAEYERSRQALNATTKPLERKGFTLNLDTLEYAPTPAQTPAAPAAAPAPHNK